MINDSGDTAPYATFRFFYARLTGKTEKEVYEFWEEIQKYFQRFDEWYCDRTLYHKIGFVLTAKIAKVKDLYSQSATLKKSEFITYIDEIIKKHYKDKNLFDLDYEDDDTRDVLLLYNILTMLQNDHDSSYFPFDAYKLNKWNKEHIASRKDASTVPVANRKQWLTDVRSYIDKGNELIGQLNDMLGAETITDDQFKDLYDRITAYFNQKMKSPEDDIDSISNLALLDEKTNKSYKNAVFPLKRKYIIDLDKTGGFVPLCTKNVFLKYFSDYPPISFWTQDDREKYEQDLKRVLATYLEVE